MNCLTVNTVHTYSYLRKYFQKLIKASMGKFWMRKYLSTDALTFAIGLFLVIELAVIIFERIRHSAAVSHGVFHAFEEDIMEMTYSISELYRIQYGVLYEKLPKCQSDVKYAVILLTEAQNIEYRENMRLMWRDFELVVDVATKNGTKVVPPTHQIFFLVHSLQDQSNEVLRSVINESIIHRDIFFVENVHNISSLANENLLLLSCYKGAPVCTCILQESIAYHCQYGYRIATCEKWCLPIRP